jgi:hypothetical protein
VAGNAGRSEQVSPTIATFGCARFHPFDNGKPQKRAGHATRERRKPWRRQASPFPESVIHRELVFQAQIPRQSRQRVPANQPTQRSPIDLQPLTAIQQNNFTPQPLLACGPITLTVCVTPHPSTTSRQHYFHRTAPLYMERRIYFRRTVFGGERAGAFGNLFARATSHLKRTTENSVSARPGQTVVTRMAVPLSWRRRAWSNSLEPSAPQARAATAPINRQVFGRQTSLSVRIIPKQSHHEACFKYP